MFKETSCHHYRSTVVCRNHFYWTCSVVSHESTVDLKKKKELSRKCSSKFYKWKYKTKPRHKQEGHYARQTLLLLLNHGFCDSAKYKLQNQKQQKRQNTDLTHTLSCNIWKYSHYSTQFHRAIPAVFWRQTKGKTVFHLCFMLHAQKTQWIAETRICFILNALVWTTMNGSET